MKLRRLVPLALAAFAAWRRMSPQQKTKVRSTISDVANRLKGRGTHDATP